MTGSAYELSPYNCGQEANKIGGEHKLTHWNNLFTSESIIPWLTSRTKPCCDRLANNSEASFCRSDSSPLRKREKSRRGRDIWKY